MFQKIIQSCSLVRSILIRRIQEYNTYKIFFMIKIKGGYKGIDVR